jgi:hypothetical protein
MATPNSEAIAILQSMEKSTDDASFVSRVEKRINDALDEIAIATNYNMFRTRAPFNTAASTAVYQLPVGGRDIEQLRYTDNGQPLWLWTPQEAARYATQLEEQSRAAVWLEDGIVVDGANVRYQFRLARVPDSILEIEQYYYFHPSEVTTAQVIPVLEQFIPLIRHFVKAELYELDGMLDRAQEQRKIYNALVEKLEKREKRKLAAATNQRYNDLPRGGGMPQAIFDGAHFRNQLI